MNYVKASSFLIKPRIALIVSLPILLIAQLLVFNLKLGVLLTGGLILILIGLLKPDAIYLLLVSSFAIENFSAVPGVSYARIIGIFMALALALRLVLRKETIPKDDLYKYFFLFFLGGLVSFAFAKKISVSISVYLTYISLVILYIATRYFIKTEKNIYTVLNVLFIATIVSIAYLMIMMSDKIFIFTMDGYRLTGGIGDSNEYASYILVLLPLSVYRAMNTGGLVRILYSAIAFILLVIVIYTGSRGGLLGFLGVMLIFIQHYGVKKLKYMVVVLLLLSVSAFFFLPERYLERAATITSHEKKEDSRDARIENYRIAINMFLDRPVAGFGWSNFEFVSADYGASHAMVVHNTYLEILVGGGLLSFIPFLLILINSWKRLKIKNEYKKNIRDLMVCLKASFVSILITSFFLTAGHKKILWFLLALISSVYYVAQRQHKFGGNAPRMP